MQHGDEQKRQGFFASRSNLVLLAFLAVGGFYLISEHWAHLVGAGPLLLLLGLCIGMHLFMHGGHAGHGSSSDDDPPSGGRATDGNRH